MRSLTSLHESRACSPQNFRSSVQNEFLQHNRPIADISGPQGTVRYVDKVTGSRSRFCTHAQPAMQRGFCVDRLMNTGSSMSELVVQSNADDVQLHFIDVLNAKGCEYRYSCSDECVIG